MPTVKPTRTRPHWVFLVLCGFFFLEVVGGVALSLATNDGRVIALTSFCAGILVSLGLWWWTRDEAGKGILQTISRFGFSGVGGLAFYANVTYALWAADIPIDLGIVRDGRMGEHFWLGPFTLAYAVGSYFALKWKPR